MQPGAFSVGLAVKDMAASREFHGELGFEMIAGDGETWTSMANETTVIGVFRGMFEASTSTFNPGCEGPNRPAESFTDVRELRTRLAAAGITPHSDTTARARHGPASFTIADPDGNVILNDQRV